MKKKAGPAGIAIVLIVILALIWIVWKVADRYIPSKEVMDPTAYFGVTDEHQAAVILQDHLEEIPAWMDGERVYLAYETVKNYLNDRFYYDAENSQLLYTTPVDILKIPVGGMEYTTINGTGAVPYQIAVTSAEHVYIALDFISQYTNLEYTVIREPLHIIINYEWGTRTYAQLDKDEAVRLEGGIKSLILTNAAAGETVTVLEQMEDWTKVMTADGYIGYVRNKRLGDTYEQETQHSFDEPVYTSLQKDYKINLLWHQVTSQESNAAFESDMQDVKGVNTVSPTWFSIVSNDGEISSIASAQYVEQAHARGIEVWGLLNNFDAAVSTYEVLSHTSSREKLENRLIEEAQVCGLDGINIDIESLSEDAADGYVQFMRELSVKCRNAGLVLSVDVPPPYEFNAHYNRAALGEVVDYVIIMGYDEHYVGSEPGSVASLSYEKEGIIGTLSVVPKEKIISGIPFYTRLWRTDGDGEVSSEAIGMNAADAALAEYQATANWSQDHSQDYAEFNDNEGNFCQIWLENEKSIEEKMKLVQEYELGGVAEWRLGFERASVWEVISRYLAPVQP